MKNFLRKKNKKVLALSLSKGYALLFTMVIVSVIMVIATGISRSISKQLILSATALNSQIAFYEADTAGECALYASQVKILNLIVDPFTLKGTLDCGQAENGNTITLDVTETGAGSNIYNLIPDLSLRGPCFNIEVDESGIPSTIKAYGYNICNLPTNNNLVERGIEIEY
ncbi:pilus assembly PilX N-terminal domain-containing protein [Candidatus Nomurabacteria bacterium]|nr:pilus assembly PilX N-terminal domain-containing protein [Candidatus Nomurabacteria bacterium]